MGSNVTKSRWRRESAAPLHFTFSVTIKRDFVTLEKRGRGLGFPKNTLLVAVSMKFPKARAFLIFLALSNLLAMLGLQGLR